MTPSEERDDERQERRAAWLARERARLSEALKHEATELGRALWRFALDFLGGNDG